jgi:hypothetical protein
MTQFKGAAHCARCIGSSRAPFDFHHKIGIVIASEYNRERVKDLDNFCNIVAGNCHSTIASIHNGIHSICWHTGMGYSKIEILGTFGKAG